MVELEHGGASTNTVCQCQNTTLLFRSTEQRRRHRSRWGSRSLKQSKVRDLATGSKDEQSRNWNVHAEQSLLCRLYVPNFHLLGNQRGSRSIQFSIATNPTVSCMCDVSLSPIIEHVFAIRATLRSSGTIASSPACPPCNGAGLS
jgi:hypothetical protein